MQDHRFDNLRNKYPNLLQISSYKIVEVAFLGNIQYSDIVDIPQILAQDKDYLFLASQLEELLVHVEIVEM